MKLIYEANLVQEMIYSEVIFFSYAAYDLRWLYYVFTTCYYLTPINRKYQVIDSILIVQACLQL